MDELAIGGVLVVALIAGLVEFSKKFGVEGNWCIVESFVLGVLFSALALAINSGAIPPEAAKWIELAVGAIAFGLGTSGLYDLGMKVAGKAT